MTPVYSTSPALDLPTLDGAIRLHLQAYARRVGGLAERYATNAGEQSACVSLIPIDADQDIFSGCAEAVLAYRMYAAGYETALALAAVTSRSPLNPNESAIAAVLRQTREKIAETVADERAKWGLPA